MKSFREELALEFPETPESFRECVERAVEEQIVGRSVRAARWGGRNKTAFFLSRITFPVAACLVLFCGIATVAAGLPVFQRWLTSLGVNEQAVEELLIHEEEIFPETQTFPGGEPGTGADDVSADTLFAVTDAYFDGATLMFWAVPGASLDTLEFGDHVYINGSDSRLEYVAETRPGSGVYECKVTVMDERLMGMAQDALEITVEVYVPGAERAKTSFRIESDKIRTAVIGENHVLELPYGTVEVCDLSVAPSSVKFHLKWKVYREEIRDLIYIPDYFVEDSSGVRRRLDEVMRSSGVSEAVYDASAGCWEFEQELEFTGFDSSSEYMILIPYEGGWDEDGNRMPGTEILREDMSFKVLLK